MLFYCIQLALFAEPSAAQASYPSRIQSLLRQTRSGTSQVEWTVTWIGGYDDGLVERYVTRTVGDATWESNLGDENGFHRTTLVHPGNSVSGIKPGPGMTTEQIEKMGLVERPREQTAGVRNRIVVDEQAWYLNAEKPNAGDLAPVTHPSARVPMDLSSIGLRVRWESEEPSGAFGLAQPHAAGLDAALFSEHSEGDQTTVTAKYDDYALTWKFDKRQGDLPTEAMLTRKDLPLYRSETQYQRVGERWVPASVRFFGKEGAAPYKIVDVHRATLNELWHVKEITADDTGRVYGTQFSTPDGQFFAWNGVELMDSDAFWEMAYLYELFPDRRILEVEAENAGVGLEEYIDSLRRHSEGIREVYFRKHGDKPWLEAPSRTQKDKDEWDLYVERFLTEHQLPKPAVERAHDILKQAKGLRDARRKHNAAEIRQAEKEKDQRKLDQFADLERKIFDRVLVRSLKKLIPEKKPETSAAPD